MDLMSRTHRFVCRLLAVMAIAVLPSMPAYAVLTSTTLTWDVIGLDSNDPVNGPQIFPMGARVCTDASPTTGSMIATFSWDDGGGLYFSSPMSNPYINLRDTPALSPSTLNLGALAANTCADAFFEVQIQPVAGAYNQFRRYRVSFSNGIVNTVSPTPRQVFVERLVSQNRNSIPEMRYQPATGSLPALNTPYPIPLLANVVGPGSGLSLVQGATYDIQIIGATATQGYEQFASFISFNRTIFQILGVRSSYTANTAPAARVPNANDRLYADACLWQPSPLSLVYRSCLDLGKTGGNFIIDYRVRILSGGGTSEQLNSLVYDFSGSSYHYNADFSANGHTANIIDPTTSTIAKSFTPASIPVNGLSTLAITITNPNPFQVDGYEFDDALPAGVTIANVAAPLATTSGCGTSVTYAPALAAAGTAINARNISVGPNSTCTVSVKVTSSVISAGHVNNIPVGAFRIAGMSTGQSATANLAVTAASAVSGCTPGSSYAQWGFSNGGTATVPLVDAGNLVTPATALGSLGASSSATNGMALALLGYWEATYVSTAATLDRNRLEFYEFTVNTVGLNSLTMSFDTDRSQQGPTQISVFIEGTTPLNIGDFAVPGTVTSRSITTSAINPTGNTVFRIYPFASGNDNGGHYIGIDNVRFSACAAPRIQKSFLPNPIGTGQTSTLTLTVTNTNRTQTTPTPVPTSIAGVAFTDTLPAGMVFANPTNLTTSASCGTPTYTPAIAPGGNVIGFSAGTLALAAALPSITPTTCTITVDVTTATAGSRTNTTGTISATVTGPNTTPSGSATASLDTLAPPTIDKAFLPASIATTGTSRLTFTVRNQNTGASIVGVQFSDTLPTSPGQMRVAATPNVSTSGCGTPTVTALANGVSVGMTGGIVAAGGTCTVSVDVTVPIGGNYNNTSGAVQHLVNATNVGADTATSSLVATTPVPRLQLTKEVSTSVNGPWVNYLVVPLSLSTPVFYRFTVENTGDLPLARPVGGWVSDPSIAGEENCGTRVAAPADYWPAILPVVSILNNDHIATCIVGPIQTVFPGVLNTATASSTTPGTANSTDTAEYRIRSATVEKSASPPAYSAANTVITYTYVVRNTGSSLLAGFNGALGPVLTDDQIGSVSCNAFTTVGNMDGFFDPGEAITCTKQYTTTALDVTNQRTITNTATAFFESYSTVSNVVNVFFNNTGANPFLLISKSISPNAQPGFNSVYTIAVTNGGSTATQGNVVVRDFLPTEVTFVNTTPSDAGWSCAGTTNLVCTFTGPLAAGATTNLRITVTVGPTIDGPFTNSAIVGDPAAAGSRDQLCNNSFTPTSPGTVPMGTPARCFASVTVTTVPVTISDVSSRVENGELVVNFGTALEAGTLGFRVLTGNGQSNARVPLNPTIVRAQRTTLQPQRYEVRGPFTGQTTIYIQEISITNKKHEFGPYAVGTTSGEIETTAVTDWRSIGQEQAGFRVMQRQRLARDRGRGPSSGLEAEVKVDRSGWVAIRHEDLVAQGIDWGGTPAHQIQLSGDTGFPPLRYDGPEDFGPGSVLSFLGNAVDGDLYTKTRVYRLRVNDTGGFVMGSRIGAPGNLPLYSSARDVFRFNPDVYYDFASPNEDPWYAYDVTRISTPSAEATRSFSLPNRSSSSSNEKLTVDLYGGLDFPETPDHSVRISLNGTVVATARFDGITRRQIRADLPDGLLQAAGNSLAVELVGDTDVYADIVLVNGFSVEYSRELVATDNRVDFDSAIGAPSDVTEGDKAFADSFEVDGPVVACVAEQPGCQAWRVTGLTSPDVVVVRQGRDTAVETLTGVEIVQAAGGFELHFASAAAVGDHFWIAPRSGGITGAIGAAPPVTDPLAGGSANYLIVAHPSFVDGLAPYVAARQAEGFTVKVVDVESLYRWYSAGKFGADAISLAINDAYYRLGTRYVLLVGGDTYDYFNYEGSGSVSFVPTHYRRTDALVTYAPTDMEHADVDNDDRVDLAIGRWPVRTAEELDAVIAKTLAYTAATPSAHVLRLTDRKDGDNDFSFLSRSINSGLPNWTSTAVALQDYANDNAGVDQARQALVAAVNSGQSLVTYFGHSGPNTWTREGLVTADLVYNGMFDNAAAPNVTWQLGCWGAYFVDPYYNTIAHGLLLQSNGGGAAALIGASALTEAGNDVTWMNVLTPRLRSNARLGDAMVDSQHVLNAQGVDVRDVSIGGTLLGDPTLRIKGKPEQ